MNHQVQKASGSYILILMLTFASLMFGISARAQVSTIPVFPLVDDSVTIIFDATQGNGALANFTGIVYAHTGLITNLSTSPTDWRYVQGVWGTADPEVQMTSLGNNLYRLKYHIRNYYGLPQGETALQMAFVFRNATGSIVGRASDGSDIYVDIFQPGLNVSIVQPTDYGTLIEPGGTIGLTAVSTLADGIAVYLNGVQMNQTTNDTLIYNYTPGTAGKYRLKVKAWSGTSEVWDSVYYLVRPTVQVAALPAGMQDGINIENANSVVLSLYAPQKNYVFAVGDYSNWEMDPANYMKRTPSGDRYWIRIENLDPNTEYAFQYFIDNSLKVADPYSEKVLDPWNDNYIPEASYPDLKPYPSGKTTGIVGVFQTDPEDYQWQVPAFVPYPKTNSIVYELLIRDFTTARSYQSLIDTLNYLKTLGVNVIELMPVNEFEGNLSWGYNPSFFFAPDKFYGTANSFKAFIDQAHQLGMAVIMDIALNHAFGQCPLAQMYWDAVNNRPAANNPWFNPIPKHDFNVGNDFNHGSAETKKFASRVLKHWVSEFKIDGYRFDLSKGFTQNNTLGNTSAWGAYDASRISILKAYADSIYGVNPNAILVLEHFADNQEEKELSDYGFLLWGNMNYNYNEATMGWVANSDLSWGVHSNRGWANPHLLTYMESHDEERLMAKNIAYGNSTNASHNVKEIPVGLSRIELAAAFFLPLPGPKMIWQFGELGYDYHINYPGVIGGSDNRLTEKPVRWDYYADPNRNRLYNVFKWLNWLKKNEPVFQSGQTNLSLSGGLKRYSLSHSSTDVVVLGNFNVQAGDINPNFTQTGKWYEFFSGDSIEVSDVNATINLQPGEYRLYMKKRFPVPVLFTPPWAMESLFTNQSVDVFPNPSADKFHFSFPESSSPVLLEIIDLTGRIVDTIRIPARHPFFIWDAGKAEPGLYFYRLSSGKEQFSGKIIKR